MRNNAVKGFDKTFTAVRMWWNMLWRLLVVFVVLHILISLVVVYFSSDYFDGKNGMYVVGKYAQSWIVKGVGFGKSVPVKFVQNGYVSLVDYQSLHYTYGEYVKQYLGNYVKLLLNLFYIYMLVPIVVYLFYLKNKKETDKKVIRGAGLVDGKELRKLIRKDNIRFSRNSIKITKKIRMPESIVTRHNFVIGKSGSGKSQLIYRIIQQLIAKKERAIIHDFKGDMISIFYNPKTDLIFNPLDKRHVNWNLFGELKSEIDVLAFTNSLIPDEASGDVFWSQSSRTILNGILIHCIKTGKKNYEELWETINTPNDKLLPMLEATPGCEVSVKLLQEEKTANNIMSVLSNYTQCFQFLLGTYDPSKPSFSIKEWIEDKDSKKRVIYLSNKSDLQDTLRPLLAMFVDFSTKTLCSLPDDMSRRIYFILDEFGQLGKLPSIKQLLTQARSKGGAAWLLIQDISQVNSLYTQDGSTTIFNGCGNKIYFSVADNSTADFISKNIGEIEVVRSEESHSMAVSDLRDSISQSSRQERELIVLPNEIMNLKTLSFYAKMTDLPPIKGEFKYKAFKNKNESFMEKEGFYFEAEVPKELKTAMKDVKIAEGSKKISSLVGEDLAEKILEDVKENVEDVEEIEEHSVEETQDDDGLVENVAGFNPVEDDTNPNKEGFFVGEEDLI